MNVTQSDIDALIEAWAKISKEAEAYFERVWQILIRESGGVEQLERYGIAVKPEFIAEADSSGTMASFAKEIPKFVIKLIEASKSSP